MSEPLVRVEDLVITFGRLTEKRTAVDNVSLTCVEGEVTGLVGESGSGKSTIARAIVGLVKPASGRLFVEGEEIEWGKRSSGFGRVAQMVFQDPYSTLDPTQPVWRTIVEPLEIHEPKLTKKELRAKAAELLELVQLDPGKLDARPSQFSGGQRQRLAIARALSVDPRLLVADEAVSALDVTTQAQIVRLLEKLRRDRNLGILFISHDLNTVKEFAQHVLVLSKGQVVERGTPAAIFENPQEEYTKKLIDAIPSGDPTQRRRAIKHR